MFRKNAKKEVKPSEASIQLQARVQRMFDLEKKAEDLTKILRLPHYDGTVRVAGLKDQLEVANYGLVQARQKLSYAKDQQESVERQGRSSTDDVQKAKAAYELAKRELERAERAVVYFKEQYELVKAEFDAVEAELAELKQNCGLEYVINFQQVLATAEQRVPELKDRIAELERVIEEAKASVPSADELLKQREDVGAALLTGNATEADLKAVNEQLQALNQAIEAASEKRAVVLDQVEPDLRGLRRSLEKAEGELKNLTLQKPEMARLVLKAKASAIYADYVKLGREIGEKFEKLVNLNALIGKVKGPDRYSHSFIQNAQLRIPSCKLGPGSEAEGSQFLFSWPESSGGLETLEAEKQRLQAEGFTLLD